MARGAGGLLDGGFVFKLGRLFKTPYGGEGVDFIDQLNYQFTGGLMVIFIAIISLRQYVAFSNTACIRNNIRISMKFDNSVSRLAIRCTSLVFKFKTPGCANSYMPSNSL
ncbi:unnamed protein product [Trichobilharzia regenti]|nr:unnamed protein product [Trichobilharzia regenti]